MFAHIKIMNEFSTPFVRNTKLGYCLSTIEVALNHIINLTKEDLIYSEDDTNGMGERHRSMSMSFKMQVYKSMRAASLKILDDPFDEYVKFAMK